MKDDDRDQVPLGGSPVVPPPARPRSTWTLTPSVDTRGEPIPPSSFTYAQDTPGLRNRPRSEEDPGSVDVFRRHAEHLGWPDPELVARAVARAPACGRAAIGPKILALETSRDRWSITRRP